MQLFDNLQHSHNSNRYIFYNPLFWGTEYLALIVLTPVDLCVPTCSGPLCYKIISLTGLHEYIFVLYLYGTPKPQFLFLGEKVSPLSSESLQGLLREYLSLQWRQKFYKSFLKSTNLNCLGDMRYKG